MPLLARLEDGRRVVSKVSLCYSMSQMNGDLYYLLYFSLFIFYALAANFIFWVVIFYVSSLLSFRYSRVNNAVLLVVLRLVLYARCIVWFLCSVYLMARI